jgi:hypothetical protein
VNELTDAVHPAEGEQPVTVTDDIATLKLAISAFAPVYRYLSLTDPGADVCQEGVAHDWKTATGTVLHW